MEEVKTKICTKCGEEKLAKTKYFYRHRLGRNFIEKFTPNTAQRKDIFRNLMPDRDVFIMNVKEMIRQGKTQREIANELGIAVGTVNKYSKL